jgi:hypothetical protein
MAKPSDLHTYYDLYNNTSILLPSVMRQSLHSSVVLLGGWCTITFSREIVYRGLRLSNDSLWGAQTRFLKRLDEGCQIDVSIHPRCVLIRADPNSVHRTRTSMWIPRTSVQTWGTSVEVPGAWFLVPGAWHQVPGTVNWHQVLRAAPEQAFKCPEHRTRTPNCPNSVPRQPWSWHQLRAVERPHES